MNEAPIHSWLSSPLPEGVGEVLGRLRRTEGVVRIAVMPDVHLAGEFCVGTVVASERFIFPNAVGGDIGCGMLAMKLDAEAEVVGDESVAARLLGALCFACPGRRHHRRTAPSPDPAVGAEKMSNAQLEAQRTSQDARTQLGTLGAGNHFLELQTDEEGTLWLMIHTGSRHLGQCVLQHYLPLAQRTETGIMALEGASDAGQSYLHDVEAARRWARENRRLLAVAAAGVLRRVVGIKEASIICDCDHNHVQMEEHAGRRMWVHRKGATHARAGIPGVIPGSMGTHSFHTSGLGNAESLDSSSHGAGRALSRSAARRDINIAQLRRQLRGIWYDSRMERQLLEEAPGAYKEVDAVMRAQEKLTKITRRLRPLLVYKGA